ncbi:MAG: NADH-quinone oxidoreductase subunit C [Thermoanaerobaculia bacterium]
MSPPPLAAESRRVEPAAAFAALADLAAQGYNLLVDLTALDYSTHPAPPVPGARFEVVYRLASLDPETGLERLPRIELRAAVGEEPALRSVASLWPVADWLEREVWDMFGVRFTDRPDIQRLLLYEEFVGHPLRKDYPIARRQPLIGPPSGDREDSPSFNILRPTVSYE